MEMLSEREREKVEGLQKQFGYAGIEGISDERALALVRSSEKEPIHEYSLYVNKDGKYVNEGQDYDHLMNLKLKCNHDKERDWVYFNKYECAIFLKGKEEPVVLSANVSYGNTLKPLELFKMVKNDTAIGRQFYNDKKKEFYDSHVYIDARNTDNDGNPLIKRKQLDVDKIIRSSNIVDKDNPYVRAIIKDRFRLGEPVTTFIEHGGQKKEVVIKLMAQYNSLNYFNKEDMKPIRVSLTNTRSETQSNSLAQGQTAGNGNTGTPEPPVAGPGNLGNGKTETDKVQQGQEKNNQHKNAEMQADKATKSTKREASRKTTRARGIH